MRASQSGSLSIGTTAENAKMTVAGNGIIGSGLAGSTPPANGLIVEGRTLIGAGSNPYSHKMIVIDSPNYAAGIYTEVGPSSDGADGEAITAYAFAPATDIAADPSSRIGLDGALIAAGGPVAQGLIGYYMGSYNDTYPALACGIYAGLFSYNTNWSQSIRSARRAALFVNADDQDPADPEGQDWAIWQQGVKNYLHGYTGIGTQDIGTSVGGYYHLTVNGLARKPGGGSWATFSDLRLKDVQGAFMPGLDAITRLSPIRFHYKKDNALGLAAEEEFVGLAAQEVSNVIPEAVREAEHGYLILNNDPVIMALINSVKELKAENDELKNRMKKLENR